MRILVNALSAESLSGKHVLYGHLRQWAKWTRDEHDFHVLYNAASRPAEMQMGPNVRWHEAPADIRGWVQRSLWEATILPRRIRELAIDFYFSPSGMILLHSPVPQATLAQNPWCLTADVAKGITGQAKALIQRATYRRAQRSADVMIYNSQHMQQLYRQNAGGRLERRGMILHQGLDDETHEVAATTRTIGANREMTIICVSVMARWKNCETLLHALRRLRDRGIEAKLRLIGGWPDPHYRQQILAEIRSLHLHGCVIVDGHVSRETLYDAYRSAKVYCLLSRCESFGIPALEAQAFGTPVVGSNTGAMAEIGGAGGVFVNPDDPVAAASALERLLVDAAQWNSLSCAAVANAQQFRWDNCSRPLLTLQSPTVAGLPADSIDPEVDQAHKPIGPTPVRRSLRNQEAAR